VHYPQIGKSKIKQGTASGRWYKARVLSHEGATCVIDTETTVLRVHQSEFLKEKHAWNVVTVSLEYVQSSPATDYLPRGRLTPPGGPPVDQSSQHIVPEVYWNTPQHALPDVMELSDGFGTLLAPCNQHGLITGDCVYLNGKLS